MRASFSVQSQEAIRARYTVPSPPSAIRRSRQAWKFHIVRRLATTNATPAQVDPVLQAAGSSPLREPTRLSTLVKRPGVSVQALVDAVGGAPQAEPHLLDEALTTAEMELRYEGYLAKERERAETLHRQADFPLPDDLAYLDLASLSYEARQKLERIRPATLAQAGRIPGVSPSDLQNLVMEVRKRSRAVAAVME